MRAQKSSGKAAAKKSGTGKLNAIKNLIMGGKKSAAGSKKAASAAKGTAKKAAAAPTPPPAAAKGAKAGAKATPPPVKGSIASVPPGGVKAAKGAKVALTKKGGASSVGVALSSRGSSHDSEPVCREVACEGLATAGGYCRMHYIKNWKKIKRKDLILREKKLNQYIEELVAKYPDKYIEAIRQDLANDKDFAKVIHDLDLDESIDDFEMDGESAESLIDTIKRDFDDEGDAF